jgi:ribosome-binding ATPase
VLKNDIEIDNVGKWTEVQLEKFARALRKHTKPMIIAANKIDRPKAKENFEKVKEKFDYPITTCFAEGELALKEADAHNLVEYVPGAKDFEIVGDLNEKQEKALESVKEILDKYGSTGVQEVANKTVFDLLRYICVFPAGAKLEDSKGNVLPDCYLMPPGSTALDFAFRIHQDIGNGFIKAIDVRTKRAVGKEYKLKMGDGLEIFTK